jgi:hypothetical protein
MLKSASVELSSLAEEVDRAQNERNILFLETLKYEGMTRFMKKERSMI